jgi:hypothetical protein
MAGGGGRIDHPNVNAFVVSTTSRTKPKAAKKAAAPKPAVTSKPEPVVEADDPATTPDPSPAA